MKRNLFITALGLFVSTITTAQTTELHVGADANSFVVSANETIHVNGLTLTPSSSYDLTNTRIIKTTTVRNPVDAGRIYVPVVFQFNNTSDLSPAAKSTSLQGTISINYTDGIIPQGISEAGLKLHYFNTDPAANPTNIWAVDAGSSAVTGSDVVNSSNGFSATFNELVLTDGTTPLPVTWLDFTAQRQANQVLLQWSTASEINTQDFVVQHSVNASDWASLGSIDAAGNSNITNRYSYLHTTPVKGSNTINYYRILQRDLDGKFSFSKILSLRFEDGREEVLVYPNPAVHTLTMYLPTTQHVRLVNQQGALIWQGQMQAGRNQLQVSQLAKGMYYLITADGTHPVVIQ